MLRALFSRILHKESWPVCLKWQMFTVKIEPWGNINLHYSMPICSITVLNEKKKVERVIYKAAALAANGRVPLKIRKASKQTKTLRAQATLVYQVKNEHLFFLRALFPWNIFDASQVGQGWDFFFLISAKKGIFNDSFKFGKASEKHNTKHLHSFDKYLFIFFCVLNTLLSLRVQLQGSHS